ncbi:hypothetical protein [Candidatus Reidiella endopervernicosa]|uniref:Uncharacterized protein n=1 Tax=Candidatus Reidiella endopervernicosa TaxID=2738883 RepID=A0A6N0HSE2_9GAMM|nr:hypothetical protein [Candidatus Reidiella endopervernicosa]QKQ25319.1 hypothetical protein HUE57_02715 [Candidatus Reidiella endopervernicosa]
MSKELMFFCIPQGAYMGVSNCQKLRKRPVGKAPAGGQTKLRACEKCEMHGLVDSAKVPTVSMASYLSGSRPKPASKQALASAARAEAVPA